MVIELNLVYDLNENLFTFSHCLQFHKIIHDTIAFYSVHQQVLAKRISWVPGLSHSVNSLSL